jgi:hypothetical protein
VIEQIQVKKGDYLERVRRYDILYADVKAERSRQLPKLRLLTDFILPERGRFVTTDHNKPKDTSKILNNTPTRMAHALAAGLMSGVTSPARPWFNLTLPDPDIIEYDPVKRWLWTYNLRMRQVIDLSGFYRACAMGIYPDLVTYGTAACLQEEDPKRIMRFSPLAMGSYCLGQDGDGEVDTLIYEEPWTAGELVKEFGWEAVSDTVRSAWNANHYGQFFSVLRVIQPNEEFIPGSFGRRGMKWGSVWMERGGIDSASGNLSAPTPGGPERFLREGGYEEFPVMAPRWMTTARDVWGTGPGHDALPDARQLMKLESRALLGVDKGVNPAMLIPSSMRLTRLSMLPGDPVYVPDGTTQEIKPAQVVDARMLERIELKIQQAEQRIGEAFFAPLMMLFIQGDLNEGKQPITAAEVAAKRQEQMLQLGPVLENLNDFLSKFIDRTAAIMVRRGLVPTPPREIQGMPMKVEFISILFQAQKMIGYQAKQQLLQYVGQMAQLAGPDAVDAIDVDVSINRTAEDLGTPPDMLKPVPLRVQARRARAQQAQAQAQGAAMLAATEGAKNLSKAQVGADPSDNMLARMAGPIGAAQVPGGADAAA